MNSYIRFNVEKKRFFATIIASYKEPYWWITDSAGYKVTQLFTINLLYRKRSDKQIEKGVQIIVGPANIIFGWIEKL